MRLGFSKKPGAFCKRIGSDSSDVEAFPSYSLILFSLSNAK